MGDDTGTPDIPESEEKADVPERIGRFKVVAHLGTGGAATVWLARDEDLDALVAVKVLGGSWAANETAQKHFLDEARILRKLDDEHIVEVYEVDRLDDGLPYFVMEYADGGSVYQHMQQRFRSHQGYSVAEAVDVSVQLAEALTAVHDLGVVHRDLKPSNALYRTIPAARQAAMRRAGVPVPEHRMLLADFGLARRLEGAVESSMLAGTPRYMAPEQLDPARAGEADPRSDLYAAAVILYELLTGRVPFPYESVEQVRDAMGRQAARPVEELRPELPPLLARVLNMGMSLDPDRRFRSAWAWMNALRQSLAPPPGAAPRPAAPAAPVRPVPPSPIRPAPPAPVRSIPPPRPDAPP